MCGFFGIFSPDGAAGQPAYEAVVRANTCRMLNRGPDAEGHWADPEGRLRLGFRRLAVIDPSPAANQPIESPDGRSVLAMNGEIYNFRELRAELEALGVRFRTRSDSEVLLQALNQWGVRTLDRLNGMFAFAWYDRRERSLLLARDHAGIKPLFYTLQPGGREVAFGSQYDLMLRTPWDAPGAVRPEVLRLYLQLNYIPPPYALHANVHQLEPGQYLTIDSGGRIEQHAWWSLLRDPQPDLAGEAALDALDTALHNAVRRQCVADVPLGVFLSGGIDSPLVAAVSRRQVAGGLKAFTIGSPGWRQDESADAAAFARQLNLDHHLHPVSGEEALAELPAVAAAQYEPFADYSIIPTLMVSRFARQHVTVALSGDGGDELLFGYERPRSLLRDGRDFRYPHLMRIALYGLGRLKLGRARSEVIIARTPGHYYYGVNSRFGGDDALRLVAPGLTQDPTDFDLFHFDGYQGEQHLANYSRWVEFSGQLQRGLKKMDMASMHHSLEARVPLLDREVIETALRIDPFESLRDGGRKLVLRGLLSRYVPAEMIPQPKRGFAVPLGEWLRGPFKPMVEDTLLGGDLYPTGIFDRAGIRRYWQDHLEGRMDRKWGLWALLALQWWHAEHGAAVG